MKSSYRASKFQTQGRPGWTIVFRHPLRNDAKGKPGLKIRRGLGTDDAVEADQLIEEMNRLLSDEGWWNAGKRGEAEFKFSKIIVDIFYKAIQAGKTSPEKLRQAHLPLPGRNEGYSSVLFVGTTGSGKTTLLRQLIGSDPEEDRFPSTAPAKTTTSDLEVILAPGEYKAIVTFFSEHQVQSNVEECLIAACLSAFDKSEDTKIAEKLLNHSDQKFRLSYILGPWNEAQESTNDFSFDEPEPGKGQKEAEQDPRQAEILRSFVARIKTLALDTEVYLREMGEDFEDHAVNEPELIESWFEEVLCGQDGICGEDFFRLAHDIIDEIRIRFTLIKKGEVVDSPSEWPEYWTFASKSRKEFIEQVRWFSSNYWPEFGKLLTPIVQGIRVKGPLYPTFDTIQPSLVLIDGQGLGHTPDSASSVPTEVTMRFPDVDSILIVDNAKQPMQAAPQSVLRAAAASGYDQKLVLAFTHFDLLDADNLRTTQDKRDHVLRSVSQAIDSLRDVLGQPVAKAVEAALLGTSPYGRCFMLGAIDRKKLPGRAAEYNRTQLLGLISVFQSMIAGHEKVLAAPIYDPTGIGFAIQHAVRKFIGPWNAKLGLGGYGGVNKEHYNKIKALNRRIAGEQDIAYDSLRPVADMVERLTESMSLYLDMPEAWKTSIQDPAQKMAAISEIKRSVRATIQRIALERITIQQLSQWREAYEKRGPGSTRYRALILQGIYETAAPLPDTIMTAHAMSFVKEISSAIERAVTDLGGHFSNKANP
jgi:GTPase SAR1 family protein